MNLTSEIQKYKNSIIKFAESTFTGLCEPIALNLKILLTGNTELFVLIYADFIYMRLNLILVYF